MYSLTQSSYIVHGVRVHLLCDNRLNSLISNFFKSIYRGIRRFEIEPLEFNLSIVEEPPTTPANSVQVVKFPSITYYTNGKEIYFSSKDGSIISLNPVTRLVTGFLKKEILEDYIKLSSLVGAPFVEILKYYGLYSFHSAAICENGMGYLISGSSGSGKTTTSLSLVSQGFQYASDDFLVLEDLNREIIAHSFYKTFNIDQNLAERFPEVARGKNLPIPEGTKVSVDMSRIFPDSFTPYIRPDVILFPKVTSNWKSQLYPISQLEVYERLLKQSILAVDKEVARNQLKALEKLVKQTVGFEFLSGRDVYEDPKRIISLIYQVNGQNGDRKKNKV